MTGQARDEEEECLPFPSGNRVIAHLNTYVHAIHVHLLLSQSPRKMRYVSFPLDHALRSISSAKLQRDFFPPSVTVIVPMKPSDAFVLVCSNTVLKTEGGAHLANSDRCLKPFK